MYKVYVYRYGRDVIRRKKKKCIVTQNLYKGLVLDIPSGQVKLPTFLKVTTSMVFNKFTKEQLSVD